MDKTMNEKNQGTQDKRGRPFMRGGQNCLWIVTMFTLLSAVLPLPAQADGDEAIVLRQYVLSAEAMAYSALTEIDSIAYYEGKPFEGIAYERYSNGRLLRVQSYSRGHKHGYMYVWYPDGTPQLYTNYRRGHLNGRFMGWYPNGTLIYDIILNQGRFVGDYLYDDDESQQRAETEVTEGEGNIGDGQQE